MVHLCWAQDVQTALDYFSQYSRTWEKDRETELQEFMKHEPNLSDFEEQMSYFGQLEQQFLGESEHYDVGPIAIYTGRLFVNFILFVMLIR